MLIFRIVSVLNSYLREDGLAASAWYSFFRFEKRYGVFCYLCALPQLNTLINHDVTELLL